MFFFDEHTKLRRFHYVQHIQMNMIYVLFIELFFLVNYL